MNLFLVSITILIFINNPISAKNKCNNDCLTKTYCLSLSSSFAYCSKNNLVSATWSVLGRPGYDDDFVGLALRAENVGQSETRSISMAYKFSSSSSSLTNYTCSKTPFGVTAFVTQKTSVIKQGTSSYSSGVLTCAWSFSKSDQIWPSSNGGPAELISDKRGTLELKSGNKSAIVAQNIADLPIYRLQYLKCCNKVHGNDKFITIFNQTKDDYYLMRPLDSTPKVLTLSLNSSKGMQLVFNCDFTYSRIEGFVANQTKKTNISNLLYGQYMSLTNRQCHWSHPLTLTGTFGKVDTTTDVYDMKIIADGSVVYTERGVKLKNSASKLLSITSILIMIISIFLNLSI